MKLLSAHQPQYLPWLGFFDKVARADVFVLLDDVQFKKNEWQNRNRIKGPSGPQWLTVPVRHRFPQTIAEVEIAPPPSWSRKHQQALRTNYGKAPFFDAEMPLFAELLEASWDHLAPLNVEIIRRLTQRLGIGTELRLSSEVPVRDDPTLRLVDLCRELGADAYLSGSGGDYLDEQAFDAAGIEVAVQSYDHPRYPQLHGDFEPFLSIVDLLMNCGDDSLATLRRGAS